MFAPVLGFPVEHNGASTTLVINPGESVIIVLMDGGGGNSVLTLRCRESAARVGFRPTHRIGVGSAVGQAPPRLQTTMSR
jgi:hypothetical protein